MRAVKEKECIKQELKKERMGERDYTQAEEQSLYTR
jgi:hypothetical protein